MKGRGSRSLRVRPVLETAPPPPTSQFFPLYCGSSMGPKAENSGLGVGRCLPWLHPQPPEHLVSADAQGHLESGTPKKVSVATVMEMSPGRDVRICSLVRGNVVWSRCRTCNEASPPGLCQSVMTATGLLPAALGSFIPMQPFDESPRLRGHWRGPGL